MMLPFLTFIFSALVAADAPTDLNSLLNKTPPPSANEVFESFSSRLGEFQEANAPDFYFNLGLAAQGINKPELARLSLLRSLKLSPWNSQTREALRLAEGRTPANIVLVYPAHWWVNSFWLQFIPWPKVALFGMAATALSLMGFWLRQKSLVRFSLPLLGVGFLILFAALSLGLQQRKDIAGVWTAGDLRAGPGDDFPNLGSAQAGWILSAEEIQGEWQRIRFDQPGKGETVGWIRKKNLFSL